jgi:twitching motility protein PilT
MDIKQLLQFVIDRNASDLHLKQGIAPTVRIDGSLVPVPGTKVLTAESVSELIISTMTEEQKKFYEENKELDYAISLGEKARFRVNSYTQHGTAASAFRLIPMKIRSIEELQLPQIFYNISNLKSGLVLMVGPTGHGKSTSLAAMIEEINKTRAENIITIEDPVEYLYEHKKSIISQREVGADTHSFKAALKSILREDPDVVLIGEMRDFETISAAVTIAETGHLVFATLHTNSASQTIDRIVDVFPAHQQNQIRMQLANTLEAVISQRLLPAVGGGRVPALEVLLGTTAVKTNIREGKTHLIDNIILTSQEAGMIPLEAYMADLIKANKLSIEVAQSWCLRPTELLRRVQGSK